jgi:hypothetical protein
VSEKSEESKALEKKDDNDIFDDSWKERLAAYEAKRTNPDRFKKYIKYRQLEKELDKTEGELAAMAKNLAVAHDSFRSVQERQVFLNYQTQTLARKTEKAKLQIEQELKDKDIIMSELHSLYKVKEDLVSRGKNSYKRKVSGGSAGSKLSAFQSLKAKFTFSKQQPTVASEAKCLPVESQS